MSPKLRWATVTIHNSNPQGATSVRIASLTGETMYSDFSTRASLDNMVISDTRTVELPEGSYDFLFFSGSANVVDRQQRSVDGTSGWSVDIANNLQEMLVVYNYSDKDFTEMYYTTDHGLEGQISAEILSLTPTQSRTEKALRSRSPISRWMQPWS